MRFASPLSPAASTSSARRSRSASFARPQSETRSETIERTSGRTRFASAGVNAAFVVVMLASLGERRGRIAPAPLAPGKSDRPPARLFPHRAAVCATLGPVESLHARFIAEDLPQ